MATYVYLLRCADRSYYVGSTRGTLEQRVGEHNAGTFGGHTATRRPVELVPPLFALQQGVEHRARPAVGRRLGQQQHQLLAGALQLVDAAQQPGEGAPDAGALQLIGRLETRLDHADGGGVRAGLERHAAQADSTAVAARPFIVRDDVAIDLCGAGASDGDAASADSTTSWSACHSRSASKSATPAGV